MHNISIKLDNIQGNIFGGFNKDFQTFLFLKFKSKTDGLAWIKEIADLGFDAGVAHSSSADVLKFNGEFKALKAQGLTPEDYLAVAWTNLALTHQGLTALEIKSKDLAAFPVEFRDGMAARKTHIGDLGPSDPSDWIEPFKAPKDIHAVLIVAADTPDLLSARLQAIHTTAFEAGVTKLSPSVEGRTRLGRERGHEHFGFKDGVSQPGIRGVTPPDDPIGNPDQGQPGQDLLWPGEFVLNYPTQIPRAKPGVDGPNPDPGTASASGPHWTRDGSYLVFRQLAQDVPAFNQQVEDLAVANGLDPDLMGAKLVGRYKSGCPLETRTFAPPQQTPAAKDPGKTQPALADSDSLNVNFEFGDDADGKICPLSAHIRKAYPRDEQTLTNNADSESDTQTHRLLRRGIPFGGSIGDPTGGSKDDLRGLLFLCYQKSIKSQFEFVQSSWVNNPNFPPFPEGRPAPGLDPIIAQASSGAFQLGPDGPSLTVNHFVTTKGGEYFFAPSIEALQEIGAGKHG